jgi:hypothetical protein
MKKYSRELRNVTLYNVNGANKDGMGGTCGKDRLINLCVHGRICMRFEVLTAASMKMVVFWVVAPCGPVEIYRHFRGAYCVHPRAAYSSP